MKQLLESNHPNLLPDRTGEEVPESPRAREEYMFQLQKDEVVQLIGRLEPTGQQQVIALIRRNYPNSILDD